MEHTQPKTGKYALNYGLLLGGAVVIFNFMLFSMDLHYEQGFAIQAVGIILATAAIVLCIYQYKKANQGFLTISEALKLGAGVTLIGGIIGLIYFFVLSNLIEPDFMDKMYEIGREQAKEANPQLTEDQIDQGIEMQKKFAWMAYPVILIVNIIIGLVIGLIAGLIMKKAKPAY